jgi:hypothetical protein
MIVSGDIVDLEAEVLSQLQHPVFNTKGPGSKTWYQSGLSSGS